MAAHTDMALLWAFDRLIDCDPERLPNKTLVDTLLPLVAGSPLELPDQVQARLVLRMLEADLAEGRVDDDTLDYLLTLAACELDSVDAAFLAPLPALILAVWQRQRRHQGQCHCRCPSPPSPRSVPAKEPEQHS